MATVQHRKPENWLEAVAAQGHGISENRALGPREQASEAMLMGLRLSEGVDLSQLAVRFGLATEQLCDPGKLAFYQAQGLVWRKGSRIGISEKGILLLDALLSELVPEGLVAA